MRFQEDGHHSGAASGTSGTARWTDLFRPCAWGGEGRPGLFLIAAGEMGVDPERCAVVDDSHAGCEAARRAGMACFGYAERDDGVRLIAEGAKAFHSMEELPELLGL